MFKKGQLVRHKNGGNYHLIYDNSSRKVLTLTGNFKGKVGRGEIDRDKFELIGNNFKFKGAK